jgi:hypothetical protein
MNTGIQSVASGRVSRRSAKTRQKRPTILELNGGMMLSRISVALTSNRLQSPVSIKGNVIQVTYSGLMQTMAT